MKPILICTLLVLASFVGFSQNYYEEYPINVSIGTNGSLSRLECSTYDSVLQTTVSMNTDWLPYNHIVTGNAGKIGYTLWNSFNIQIGKVGFIIYDSYSHEFISEVKNFTLTPSKDLNVICGPTWIDVVIQEPDGSSGYFNTHIYYRYNNVLRKWVDTYFFDIYDWSATQDIWTMGSIGNTDRLFDADDNSFIYYDPVIDSLNFKEDYISGNIDWVKDWEDCYIGQDDVATPFYDFYMYDPSIHQLAKYPRTNLIGDEAKGIFYGFDQDSTFKNFFFLYDLSIQQWITDSVFNSYITNIIIKDRVVAWQVHAYGVYFMVYDPVSHIWIKDSTVTTGTVTGFEIQNGTVKWNDDNGPHVRGYNATQGWGNYNTTPVLNFHLTDFTSQDINMIHVRNYSMGADSFYFNFGDGVVSSNKRNVLWHTYNESGIYDVCIYDSTGASWCQQVTINICSYTGLISVANDTLCMGDSTVLSLSSSTGSIQWQHKDGINWVDELGNGATSANYLINPGETTLYRAKVTNGNCIPAYSNLLTVNVNPTIMNYQLLDSSYTRCSNVSNQISVDIPNCTYQWQIYNSLTWINITNANQMSYTDNSSISNMYRVIVSSGGCFADTSDALIVNVVAAPSVPSVTSGSICGPGNVLLQATSSSQSVYWYDTYQDSIMHIGNTFTPYTSATTNYKVKAVDGTLEPIGYPNTSIGTTGTTGSENKGIRFNCSSPATLEYFYVYPQQTGNAKIILKEAGTQIIIKSINVMMQAGSGPVRVWMMSNLLESKVYDLIAVSTSIPFQINTGGISYPISDPGVPITILGYIDSTLHTTNDYYNFYDLHISTGCKSNQALTTITHYPGLYAANITPVGSLIFCQGDSVYLTAPSSASYDYNWMRNGITVSTSGNTYWAKTAGSYSLIISNANCSDTSTAVNVRVPCIQTFDPQEKYDIGDDHATKVDYTVHFSSFTGELYLESDLLEDESYTMILLDQTGKELTRENHNFSKGKNSLSINVQNLSSGLYILKMQSEKNRFVKRWLKY